MGILKYNEHSKTLLYLTIIAVLSFLLIGCSGTYHWVFQYDLSQVEKVSIAYVTNPYQIDELNIIYVLPSEKEVEILKDILEIEYIKCGPSLPSPYGFCIVIEYDNKNYDLIVPMGPAHLCLDEKTEKYSCHSFFYNMENHDIFYEMIDKYYDIQD